MKFLRKTYWYTSVFFQKHWPFIVGAVVVSVLAFQFSFSILLPLFRTKEVSYIGRVGKVNLASIPRDIQEMVSAGLTRTDEKGNVLPALAERWSVEENGKTYRFILKKDLRWQDGKPFESKDVSYNFSDTQIISTENEVVFKLKDAFAPFPVVVSQPLFRDVNGKVIGAGLYKIVHVEKVGPDVTELHLESSERKIIYRFYPTEEQAIFAFKHGKVDRLEDMTQIGDLQTWKQVEIQPTLRTDRYLGIFFNLENPMFEKNIRQALNYGLPKPDGDLRAKGPISVDSWAYNKAVKEYDQDIDRAVELLLREVPKQKLSIVMTTTNNFQKDAEAILKAWVELGRLAEETCMGTKGTEKADCPNLAITTELRLTSFPDPANYQVLLVGQQIPRDPDQYHLWHSTQNSNFTHYKSPRVDKLLEDGRSIVDNTERYLVYQDFQQYLLEDCPAIFLKYLYSYTMTRKSNINF